MTDSPTPRRHRGSRRARRRSRGLIGPIVSSLSVLLAIGPVVWLMSRDNSTVDDATKVLNVSEDTRDDSGDAVSNGGTKSGVPLTTVTKTLPNGVVTSVLGTPPLGSAASTSTTGTPATSGTPSGSPTSTLTTPAPPTVGVTTVTVPPAGPPRRTGDGRTINTPRPPRTTPTKTHTTEPTPSDSPQQPPAGGGGTSSQERQVLEYTNKIREQQGCRALRLDKSLVEAAGKQASDMVRRHYMDHTNPDGQDPGDRMAAAGYHGSTWGENIAAGYDSAQKVMAAWMQSDGHRANILNCKFTSIGIGYDPGQVKSDWGPGSWVQDFGRS